MAIMENIKGSSHILLNTPTERKLTIGDLAKVVELKIGAHCTPAMILNYERQGLLPAPERSKGGFRLYPPETIGRLILIKYLQEEGLGLTEIKQRLEAREETLEVDLKELPTDRRAQILDAAMTIFMRNGYSETTIQAIAQEAGVSSSTIYQYFLGKEDLFHALIQRISFMDLLSSMTSHLDQPDTAKLKEQIRADMIILAQAFLESHHANAEMVRLILTESQRFPDLGVRYTDELIVPIERLLENYLCQRSEQSNINRERLRIYIHAFFGMLLNFILVQDLLYGMGSLDLPDEDLSSSLVDLFLFGLFRSDQP